MSTEPFIGEIKIFGFQFSVRGYDYCNGKLYSIAENAALFSLLGTQYGGDGQVTFALPDLQGRIPIGQGQGPGLPDFSIGEAAGSESVTLLSNNLPSHIHTLSSTRLQIGVNNSISDIGEPAGAYFGKNDANQVYAENPSPPNSMSMVVGGTTDSTGSGSSINVMNPYLVINYNIATEGIFPSRN